MLGLGLGLSPDVEYLNEVRPGTYFLGVGLVIVGPCPFFQVIDVCRGLLNLLASTHLNQKLLKLDRRLMSFFKVSGFSVDFEVGAFYLLDIFEVFEIKHESVFHAVSEYQKLVLKRNQNSGDVNIEFRDNVFKDLPYILLDVIYLHVEYFGLRVVKSPENKHKRTLKYAGGRLHRNMRDLCNFLPVLVQNIEIEAIIPPVLRQEKHSIHLLNLLIFHSSFLKLN